MRTAAIGVVMIALSACGKSNPAAPILQSIIITAPTQTIAVGETVQLSATARDVNGLADPNAKITYTATPASVLSVNETGRVIGVAPGAGSVIASSGSVTSPAYQITVTGSGSVAAVFTMPGNTFAPASATIRVGQTVAFDFPSLAHNVIFAQRAGKPADIQSTSNQTVTRVFTTAGTFPFDCTIHPGMSGQVVVNP